MFVFVFQEVTYILCNCIRSVAEILKELTSVMADSVSFEIKHNFCVVYKILLFY